MSDMRFTGTNSYIATDDLSMAINAAVTLQRPILIKGEPGTGKTQLAIEVAESLGKPLYEWHIKSTTKAQQGLYEYDAVARLRDSQLGDDKVHDISNYIMRGKVWEAFDCDEQPVLLIDEIDKADTDFQDDMLDVLDQMEFDIMEVDETVRARKRPVIIITSNAKKDLSDPFLGRCNFHHIAFPQMDIMKEIVNVHFPNIEKALSDAAIQTFYRIREINGIEKKPATRELINWIRALEADPDFNIEDIEKVPYLGVLFKKSQDYQLADMQTSRRQTQTLSKRR
jgi:MoxR-like ATPase